jgi:hypothetical protein
MSFTITRDMVPRKNCKLCQGRGFLKADKGQILCRCLKLLGKRYDPAERRPPAQKEEM